MKPSWIACWVTEKAPEMTAWLAMIVAMRREDDQRQSKHFRREEEERVLDRFKRLGRSLGQQHRPLPHIIEQQGRHDEVEPAELDRAAAEMAHVGVKRLGAGDGEDHAAHGDEGRKRLGEVEFEGVQRVQHLDSTSGCLTMCMPPSTARVTK